LLKSLAIFCLITALAALTPSLPIQKDARQDQTATSSADADSLKARAERLHRESIVIDTHNDITTPMIDSEFDLGMKGDEQNGKIMTHTDLQRMKAGGLSAEFFAIYVDRDFVDKKPAQGGAAARRALDMIDIVYEQVQRHSDSLEMAYSAE